VTDGNYSRLEATNKSQEGTIKSLEGANKSLAAENEDLRTAAVLALYANNKSPKEIARRLKLKMSEVYKILESNGEDA
jgi:DNA invertase Pin-like site-specific DNA recombinase